jgi:hypothetical protein
MKREKSLGIIFLSAILVSASAEMFYLLPSPAETPTRKSPRKKVVRWIPSGVGAPNKRSAAAVRSCSKHLVSGVKSPVPQNAVSSLIALVPEGELGLTVTATPSIAFYIPIPSDCITELRFQLMDQNNNLIYETLLVPPPAPGITSLQFSALQNLPPLEVEQRYQWELVLVIDPRDQSADRRIHGFMQRKALDSALTNALNSATPSERISLYGSQSLWFEMIATLVQARRVKPQDADLNAAWQELLTAVDLRAIADQPLVPNLVSTVNREQHQ